MAEIFPDVYDIIHPTPVSLKELAAVAVSLGIWHCEINKHRTSDTLKEFWPSCESISLKTILPDLPSTIADVIAKYVRILALSIRNWLNVHHNKVFRFYSNSKTYILNKFDDFVFDYNGTVHREKTAKRMMHSDRLSQAEKFQIACLYFFENNIRRLWPSVCENMNLNDIKFPGRPELYYWICCLRNELEKVPVIEFSVYETMLCKCMPNNSRQSVEYFWDRIPPGRRMRMVAHCFYLGKKSFVRFILPKLDEEQLAEFVNKKGVELIESLLHGFGHERTFVLSTWMYIRNVMNVSQITDLVVRMMLTEGSACVKFDMEDFLCTCFEILNNIPLDLKLTIIRTILSNHNNVLVETSRYSYAGCGSWRTIEFLLDFLSCVPVEERNVFWHSYWHLLIPRTRSKDLIRIVDICFENEDEIMEFKENIMAGNESVRDVCVSLWNQFFFDELNGFVNFCYPDTGKARRFKQQLLQSVFFGENCCFNIKFLDVSKEINEFIDDAHENADLSTDFKIQLMSSPEIQYRLSQYACEKVHKELMEFIDIFVPREQCTLMQQIKTCMIDAVKERLIGNRDTSMLNDSSFKNFLLWCLGSEDEVKKFQSECVSEFEQMHKFKRRRLT